MGGSTANRAADTGGWRRKTAITTASTTEDNHGKRISGPPPWADRELTQRTTLDTTNRSPAHNASRTRLKRPPGLRATGRTTSPAPHTAYCGKTAPSLARVGFAHRPIYMTLTSASAVPIRSATIALPGSCASPGFLREPASGDRDGAIGSTYEQPCLAPE